MWRPLCACTRVWVRLKAKTARARDENCLVYIARMKKVNRRNQNLCIFSFFFVFSTLFSSTTLRLLSRCCLFCLIFFFFLFDEYMWIRHTLSHDVRCTDCECMQALSMPRVLISFSVLFYQFVFFIYFFIYTFYFVCVVRKHFFFSTIFLSLSSSPFLSLLSCSLCFLWRPIAGRHILFSGS